MGLSVLNVRVESKDGEDVDAIDGISEKPFFDTGLEGIVRVGVNEAGFALAACVMSVALVERGSASAAEGTPWPAILRNP